MRDYTLLSARLKESTQNNKVLRDILTQPVKKDTLGCGEKDVLFSVEGGVLGDRNIIPSKSKERDDHIL